MTRKTITSRGPLDPMARASLRESGSSMRRLEHACASAVAAAAEAAIAALQNGGTLYFCGNGGSAADAQHLSAELAGRYAFERPALPAIALTTNSSSMSAIGNDYGFDDVFSRQLEGLGTRGDVLVAISTSGASANVLRAIEAAKRLGMVVIGLTGAKGASFAAACDFALITPSFSTPRVQEGHIAMGHALCELIERAMFEPPVSRRDGAVGRAKPRRATGTRVTPIRRDAGKPRPRGGAKGKR